MSKVKAVPLTAAGKGLLRSIMEKPKPKSTDLNPSQSRSLKKDIHNHLLSKGWEVAANGRDKYVKSTGSHQHIIRLKTGTVERHGRKITGIHGHHTYVHQNSGAKPVEYHKGGITGIKTLKGFTGWRSSVDSSVKSMHKAAIKKADASFKKEGAKLDKARDGARKKNPHVMFPKLKK